MAGREDLGARERAREPMSSPSPLPVRATLPDGTTLVGLRHEGALNFRGVPFAQPPLGPLRFMAPRPFGGGGPGIVLNATANAPNCMQLVADPPFPQWPGLSNVSSEDCLGQRARILSRLGWAGCRIRRRDRRAGRSQDG